MLLAVATGWTLFSLVAVLPATAALVTSSGSNNSHVGIVNYAHSYDGDSIVVNVECTKGTARASEFKAATFCKSGSDSCEAHSSTDNGNASLSIPPHKKGDLYYYADNHKASGQGTCYVSIDAGTAGNLASFILDFNYYDNPQDAFVVSFRDLDPGWVGSTTFPGKRCPGTGAALSGPTAKPILSNNDPIKAHNVICNDDFIVSLVSGGPRADCLICYAPNHGALMTINNNPGGLQQAWQESASDSSTAAGTASVSDASPPSANGSGRIRMANQVHEDRRWMVAVDPNEGTLAGVVADEYGDGPTELVSCETVGTHGDPENRDALRDYACRYRRVDDATSGSSERIVTLPVSVTQAPPSAGGAGAAPRKAEAKGVLRLRSSVIALAKQGSVLEAGDATPRVWYGGNDGGHITVIQNHGFDSIVSLMHHPDSLSPGFVSCRQSGRNLRSSTYSCQAGGACRRSPCDERSWSLSTRMELPNALFKP